MKQAIVILHGMGEQIPMQTLEQFVETLWTTDESLVARGKPDPVTGGQRSRNTAWAKPDDRIRSSELRRITTEADKHGNYTDFYEYYWAHLMHGTTWEHVQSWVLNLLWRNPFRRVPRRLLHAWIALWVVSAALVAGVIWGMIPATEDPSPLRAVVSGVGGLIAAALLSNVVLKRVGDVARYVTARPPNVARRQEIRENGVQLLDRLTASGEYDRIVVVAHSLGAIVAYDILSILFARCNDRRNGPVAPPADQPERHKLEEMIRDAAGLPMAQGSAAGEPLDTDAYQAQQARALAEAQAQGLPWLITDFVTLGSPLTHAEFLLAASRSDLRRRQSSRLLPTCPPVMEWDGQTKLHHFSYGPFRTPIEERTPHHAALFAYTRWSNLYSDERAILTGDIASGPAAKAFALDAVGHTVAGIRDIAVLPALTPDGRPARDHSRAFFTHNNYWKPDKGTERRPVPIAHHIAMLRKAVGILRK